MLLFSTKQIFIVKVTYGYFCLAALVYFGKFREHSSPESIYLFLPSSQIPIMGTVEVKTATFMSMGPDRYVGLQIIFADIGLLQIYYAYMQF